MRNLGASRVLPRSVGRAWFAHEVELRVGDVKRVPFESRHHVLQKSNKARCVLAIEEAPPRLAGCADLLQPGDIWRDMRPVVLLPIKMAPRAEYTP